MSAHPLLLQQFSLLRLLSAEALNQIAPLASTRDFAKREMVLAKGPPVPYLCFLMEGRLQAIDFTLDGREVGLYFIEPGDYFGELSLIDGEAQPEFVIATGRARVVLLPGAEIRPVLFSSPQLAEALSKRLAQRVRQQLNQRQILAVNNPLHRICAQLQIMIGGTPGQTPQQLIIKAPTHQELAIMVNLTRETVTRTFQVLLAQGVLTRQGDQLLVDKIKLEKLAQSGGKNDPVTRNGEQ
ncbi:Crp/Fnr family transcriptional regulator [Ferrovum sp.]|uniref:Crp/Fnr family transcriptional regulator n=1 Tax=Ferrovum sp. TaxID=2609467 RepID=UPI00260E7B7F|nr:Crp/Fnr family transcriptional regulator [Ferrovum sp.]